MESITKIKIYDKEGRYFEFYTKYPFSVSKGDLINIASFLDENILDLIKEDTGVIIFDCMEVYLIYHEVENGLYCRSIEFHHRHLEFPDYVTQIKEGKVFTYSLKEIQEINSQK